MHSNHRPVTMLRMRSAYRILGHTISGLVVVQAAAIAFAFFGLLNWVGNDHHTLTPKAVNDESADFTGTAGFVVHSIGADVIALLGLILLIISFFAKVPEGVKWASMLFLAVVLQFVFAFVSFGAPVVGVLHGGNAILIAWLGWRVAKQALLEPATPAEAAAVT
jgi:hypothetical protein